MFSDDVADSIDWIAPGNGAVCSSCRIKSEDDGKATDRTAPHARTVLYCTVQTRPFNNKK